MGRLVGRDADDAGGDFVMDYSLVVLTYDIDAEFLGWEVSKGFEQIIKGTYDDTVRFELVGFTLESLWAESFAVNEHTD